MASEREPTITAEGWRQGRTDNLCVDPELRSALPWTSEISK